MNFNIKFTTTLPCVKIKIYKNFTPVYEGVIKGDLIPFYSSNFNDVYSRENFTKIKLPKGLYALRVSLPYFNSISQDGKTGICFDMAVIMDEIIHLDKDLEYRLDIDFKSPRERNETIRKNVGETFN